LPVADHLPWRTVADAPSCKVHIVLDGSELPRPGNQYGISQATGELIGRYYHDEHGIAVCNIRIGNLDYDHLRGESIGDDVGEKSAGSGRPRLSKARRSPRCVRSTHLIDPCPGVGNHLAVWHVNDRFAHCRAVISGLDTSYRGMP